MRTPARLLAISATLLACLLATGTRSAPITAPPRPEYLVKTPQPNLIDESLVRITDPGAAVAGLDLSWGSVARHRYSSSQVWNADESLLAVEKGVAGILYLDGRSYRPLFSRDALGACEWHPLDPDLMVCVRQHQVIGWNVRTDSLSVLFATDAYGALAFGPGKGNLSRDGRYIALRGADGSTAFVVDLASGTKYRDISLRRLDGVNGYVTVSPSGRYVVAWQKVRPDGSDATVYQTFIFSRNGALVQSWRENHRPGHGDLTLDADGSDIMVGVSKADPDRYQVIKRRLSDGKITVLTPRPGLTQHVSARNVGEPGWVYVTYGGSAADLLDRPNWDPFYQEIVAVRLDGSGETRPIARTYSVRAGYLSEAQGSPSPDGSKVAFASNWSDTSGSIALYVAESARAARTAKQSELQ